jgi:hypothetical protein
MDDPLAVERAELLRMIEELESLLVSLQDVNAGVSTHYAQKLHQLRARVVDAQSPPVRRVVEELSFDILKSVAAEVVKWLIETLICLESAVASRVCLYECWRMHQGPTRLGWAQAA